MYVEKARSTSLVETLEERFNEEATLLSGDRACARDLSVGAANAGSPDSDLVLIAGSSRGQPSRQTGVSGQPPAAVV
jgi:hypothetical protein